jgi:hypothetical protein
MSENWSEVNPQQDPEPGGAGSWSPNGNATAEQGDVAGAGGTSMERNAAAAAGGTEEAAVATAIAGTPQSPNAAMASRTMADAADDPGVFLAELARAMQATAGQERTRVMEDIDRRLASHVERIREREAAEADRMRELATGDLAAIDTWAEAEFERINAEKARRADAVRADLDGSLQEHRSLIGQEIERVAAAVDVHRTAVHEFFDRLERETDPVALAQIATRRPPFPSLDAAAQAPAEPPETAQPSFVGVMAPEAEARPAESAWAAPAAEAPTMEAPVAEAAGEEPVEETPADQPVAVTPAEEAPAPVLAEASAESSAEGEASTEGEQRAAEQEARPQVQAPATAIVSSTPRPRSSVLQTVPALRPMGSWLGRNSNSDTPDLKE